MKKTTKAALALGGVCTAAAAAYALALRPRTDGDWGDLKNHRYAHRGLHDMTYAAPENSLAAFRRAVARGFGAELDVHLLADGSLAVFHDSDLARMTGREGYIEDLTAADLPDCRLAGTDETIPSLAAVLSVFEGTGLPLIVELKSFRDNYAALAARTAEELDKYRVPYCIESFDPRCVAWFRRNRGAVIRGQLTEDFIKSPSGRGRAMDLVLTSLVYNVAARPDFIACKFEDRGGLPVTLCRALYGAQTVYWTLRSRSQMEIAEGEHALPIFERFTP